MTTATGRTATVRAALAANSEWQAFLRHFDFSGGFAFLPLFLESAENADLCREALENYLRGQNRGNIRFIAPNTPQQVMELPFALHKPIIPDTVEALWVESVVPQGSVSSEEWEEWRRAWRLCFASLNQIRNQMQRSIPCALVFAVAPWLQEIIRDIAPDLWSIRSTVSHISLRASLGGFKGTSEQSERVPFSDPSLAPDPEFAEKEARKLRGKPSQELALARLLQRAGEGYLAFGNPKEAIRVLEEAQGLQQRAGASLGTRSTTETYLGRAYQKNAEWAKAEACFRTALELDHKAFGEESVSFSTDLVDLAALLQDTDRLAEAEPLFRHALAIDEKSYGPEHPEVAASLGSLASLLQDTNRVTEAEPLYRRALAIDEKSFGADHPAVAIDLNNLASLLRDTNRPAEAEPLFRRALAINEKSYTPDHPAVATDLNNLALLLKDTNRLAEAEPLYRRALAIDEKSYGPEHPDVARSLNNLAGLLQSTDRSAEAESLLRRALAILEKFNVKTGYEHPRFNTVRDNYQLLLDQLDSQKS